MLYLLATYWMWSVAALLVGGAVGYWFTWRQTSQDGVGRLRLWFALAFVLGLVVAGLHWLPARAGLYLETLLLLGFCYAVGGLLGGLLGKLRSRVELAALTAKAAEEARTAAAAKAAEARRSAAAKAAEETRLALAAKAVEEERQAAAANAAKEARLAAAAKAVEEARQAAAAKAAEEARQAAAAKAAEEARLAAAAKAAEEARQAAAAKAAEEARQAAAAKAAEEARLAAAARAAEEARQAAAAKAAEEARQAAAAKAADEERRAAAAKAADQARLAAAAKEAEAAAVMQTPAVAAVHAGARPAGVTMAEGGHADDLKLIKGIGPKNEKSCNALGIHYFRQIADWSPDEAVWVGHHLAFPGRIEREHWIAQAGLLASGGDTDHSAGVKSGAIVVDDSADAPLDAATAERLAKSLPQEAAAVEGEADHAGRRPLGLAAPLGGKPDDLKRIRGIGPQNEGRLHGLGIWHFSQIAAWSADNAKWVGSYLAFRGRIDREKWIEQASELAVNRETEFSRRVAAGKVATSKEDGSQGQDNVRTIK
jgi:predicted flap endonuclease-1-like 5' DNA nuclease